MTTLGERESSTAKLDEAVTAYREALKERTRERAPLDWAISTGQQGVTLMYLAQRKRNAALARTAVVQIEAARGALTAVGDFRAGYFEPESFPKALSIEFFRLRTALWIA
ncbi:MAG TPA: hypothetical protein VNX70_13760 [Bryobacteraceae bacterium]|nr:hypothetical protein [Bryobacteraceae bacterium]